jgi:hypothetical protein
MRGDHCEPDSMFSYVSPIEQNLLSRNKPCQQVEFHFVQLKQLGVMPAIERRVGE